MKIDPTTLMFTDITDEEAKDMQEVATAITLKGAMPSKHPEWLVRWLMATNVEHDQHPLMISQVLSGRVFLSLLLRSQEQNTERNNALVIMRELECKLRDEVYHLQASHAELASAKVQIAELLDPDMPGENHSADMAHFIDHSNEGWRQVGELRRRLQENESCSYFPLATNSDKYLSPKAVAAIHRRREEESEDLNKKDGE